MLLAAQLLPLIPARPAVAASSSLLITSVQASSATSGTEEFIELFNKNVEVVDVTGWKVEYLTAKTLAASVVSTLSGSIEPGAFLLLARDGYLPDAKVHFTKGLDDSGGHIRLRDADGVDIDLLGWGTASAPEGVAATELSGGHWLERKLDTSGAFIDTDNNATDFALNVMTSDNSSTETPAGAFCEGTTLSEILPNPAGTDTGHEFIELYNPTAAPLSLEGCSLQIAGSSKVFKFPVASVLGAGAYKAFYDSETGLTLPNAAGGTVVLADADSEQAVQYPAALDSDEAWISSDGQWQISNVPSPNQANVVRLEPEEESEQSSGLAPCPEGKYRNPETNRCKSLVVSVGLAPCPIGQVRNVETSRCRSSVLAATTLTPCKAGQERNPETNRCRGVVAATNSLKPCNPGQERNPETNRCRNAAASSGKTGNKSTPTASGGPSRTSYAIIALVAIVAVGYAAYEYRHDLQNSFAALKARFPAKTSE